MTNIRIPVVGGTIDKVYDPVTGRLDFAGTHIPELLRQARCRPENIAVQVLKLVDSLEMTDEDRTVVRDACSSSPEDRIIVTHGTDTMAETARFIATTSGDKTIVLVGAMVPWSFGCSDSMFNMGAAITAVQLLRSGVYVTMSGGVFPSFNVRKNKALGAFEAAA